MPRAPRIEFENAVYHVMARGNHRADIVFDDADREIFQRTLAEACVKSGWQVFAWVLMSNHYHLAFRTPQPNLVAGMSWFQNTFTRRINAKNGLWGRLFGDRYKSVLVDSETASFPGSEPGPYRACYLASLIDYIHLNPARAGIVSAADNPDASLRDHRWSSFASGYLLAPSKRPPWLAAGEGLEVLGHRDTAKGRRDYEQRLDNWARSEEAEKIDRDDFREQSLQSTLRRGWYWGGEVFKERMIERFGNHADGGREHVLTSTRRRSSQARDFSMAEATRILEDGMKSLGLAEKDIAHPERGDPRRAAIGWVIWRRTSGVPHSWIAETLGFRTAANSSQQIRLFGRRRQREIPREIRKWMKKFDCNIAT